MIFDKTYQMAPGSPPPPMGGQTYRALVEREWADLLASSPMEKLVQSFLERHPVMVPGAFGMAGLSSGHSPFPGGLIAQPRLYGLHARVPDLLWIAKDSTHLRPVFIEIERPGKLIFKSNNEPTADFSQARHQLAQWRQWLSDPQNLNKFLDDYGLGEFRRLTFKPHFLLVFGRRAEFEHDDHKVKMIGSMMGENESLMSFDRLSYEPKSEQLLSLLHTKYGYEVNHIPPTYALGPGMFHYRKKITGRAAAVDKNSMITPARKAFLHQRIPYWEAWERKPTGMQSDADYE